MWYFICFCFFISNFFRQRLFSEFFLFKSMWGEMISWWRVYSCCRKAGRDLKSNVYQVSLKIFFYVLKVEIDFRELLRKSWEGFGFHGKILTMMWCHRKLSILWCLGFVLGVRKVCNANWLGKTKVKHSQKYGGTEWHFFFLSVFYFDFVFLQYDVRQVWWDLVKTWTLFYMICFGNDRRF